MVAADSSLLRSDLGTAASLALVAGWLGFALLRGRWLREPPEVLVEDKILPDDPPAVVEAMRAGGAPGPRVIGVVALDLARRGFLEITYDGVGGPWSFRRLQPARGDFRPYETAVFTRLFAAGDVISHFDLLAWARANKLQAGVFLQRVLDGVGTELEGRGYVWRRRRISMAANVVISLLVVGVGVAALSASAWVGWLALASGVGQGLATRFLQGRTASGAARRDRWDELQQALREMDTVPVGVSLDRERWLVYAVALGVAEEFVAGLERRQVELDQLAPWYAASGDGGRLASMGRLPVVLGEAFAAAIVTS
jgi:predicted membrane protein DUF2207